MPPAALPGRGPDGAHGDAPEQTAPLGQRLPPHAQVHAANDALPAGAGVQAHDGDLPPCPHRCTLGALGAWPPRLKPVLAPVAGRRRPRMGPPGCLGQGGLSRVLDLNPSGPPSARRGMPCRAHSRAIHPPSAVPPPHPPPAAAYR